MYSDYYERDYTGAQVRKALSLYKKYMQRHNLEPEVTTFDGIQYGGSVTLNHMLYHTELQLQLDREHDIDSEDALSEALQEHEAIIDFLVAAKHLSERAEAENLRLVFHVFATKTDDFLEDPHEALILYLKHRGEDEQTSVRLWYELQLKDEEYTMVEENHMIGCGAFPG